MTRQVEMILRRLGSLSTLPQVATGYLPHVMEGRINTAALSDIIESDPALTARILSLASQQGIEFQGDRSSVAEAVAKLPGAVVRDAAMSVKVLGSNDDDPDPDSRRVLPRKQLALFSLAVACGSREIAEILLPEEQRQTAFTAGLLANMGILALDEVMPKSLEKIAAEAKDRRQSLTEVERRHLGIDHILLGKRLAETWGLPGEITLAIWLQNIEISPSQAAMPGFTLSRIVRLATTLARHSGIGHNGDFDIPLSIADATAGTNLSSPQIESIRAGLGEKIAKRAAILGLDLKNASSIYLRTLSEAASRLAHNNTSLETRNRQVLTQASQLEFIRAFVGGVTPEMSAVETANHLAVCWRDHFQAGTVCVYFQRQPDDMLAEMICVEANGRSRAHILRIGPDYPAVPDAVRKKFGIVDPAESAPWINEQVDLDLSGGKLFPLLAGPQAIGAMIVQDRIPVDPDQQAAVWSVSAMIAARFMATKLTGQRQSEYAEQFADLLGRLHDTRTKLAETQSISAMAEVAAGAGHELNTPLTVISGRAQLLHEVETDDNKRFMLKQIQDRAAEISDIITDLMRFAKPTPPSPQSASVQGLIDQAIQKTAETRGVAKLEVEILGLDKLGSVFVDPEQIVEAIGHILGNALESYKGESGPIRIDGSGPQTEGRATITISDRGSGMDSATLQKVFQPFFSAKPAGRKRGMGLSHALRLLTVNDGTLRITSEPGKGTTAILDLPRK